MLKVAAYWKSLEHSLKLMVFSLLGKLNNLFVILICSWSTILLYYSVYAMVPTSESQTDSQENISANPLYFNILLEALRRLLLYFFLSIIVLTVFIRTVEILKTNSHREQLRNPSISFLLNDSHSEELASIQYQPTIGHINEALTPVSIMSFPNTISPLKYRLAASPSSSNNGILTHDSRSILSPSSDILSPLLSLPIINSFNGHLQTPIDDQCNVNDNIVRPSNQNSDRNRVRCSSTEFTFNMVSVGLIILSSLNMILNTAYDMSWTSFSPGQSLWLEVIFILCIAVHITYKIKLPRFPRDTFLQISCILDLIIILATAIEIFSSGMKWLSLQSGPKSVKVFLDCAKIISACRGLLLFSRISWLKMIETIRRNETESEPSNSQLKVNTSVKWQTEGPADETFTPSSTLVTIAIFLFLLNFGVLLGLLMHTIGSWNEVHD